MFAARTLLLALLAAAAFTAAAQTQTLSPLLRLHKDSSPYAPYRDAFCSGFLQGAAGGGADGFLQMPVVGKPLLAYIGEKDSTQYMAYASGYSFSECSDEAGRYALSLSRYGVAARAERRGGFVLQRYAYPDTLAEKGFLLDVDNASAGAGSGDVDVAFIDRHTIRAHKRGAAASSAATPLYYYARFSHPCSGYNVRREKVTLKNGTVMPRCRAVFYFDLKAGEELTVASAVSAQSSNAAYALVEGKAPARLLSDARRLSPPQREAKPQAGADGMRRRPAATPAGVKSPAARPAPAGRAAEGGTPFPFLEVSTTRAELRTAFCAALARLAELPEFASVKTGAGFLRALARRCPAAPLSPAALDSCLARHTAEVMEGGGADKDGSRAAWYALNAIGFAASQADTLQLARPLFNVVWLRLDDGGRQLLLYAKNNGPAPRRVLSAAFAGQPVGENGALPLARLQRGGILEVRMGKGGAPSR